MSDLDDLTEAVAAAEAAVTALRAVEPTARTSRAVSAQLSRLARLVTGLDAAYRADFIRATILTDDSGPLHITREQSLVRNHPDGYREEIW